MHTPHGEPRNIGCDPAPGGSVERERKGLPEDIARDLHRPGRAKRLVHELRSPAGPDRKGAVEQPHPLRQRGPAGAPLHPPGAVLRRWQVGRGCGRGANRGGQDVLQVARRGALCQPLQLRAGFLSKSRVQELLQLGSHPLQEPRRSRPVKVQVPEQHAQLAGFHREGPRGGWTLPRGGV